MIDIFMEMLAACKDKVWDYANKYYQKILLWNFKRKEKKRFYRSRRRLRYRSILSSLDISFLQFPIEISTQIIIL